MSRYLAKLKSLKQAIKEAFPLEENEGTLILKFSNPVRRKNRPFTYNLLQSNYCEKTGDILNIYCAQKYNSKTLQYFIEICPPKESEKAIIINSSDMGITNPSLRDCKNMVKKLVNGR